jgi:hypothetical protein
VRDPRAYLVRVVTHQERLPDTLLTSPDIVEDVELAESVSIAMLTVLSRSTANWPSEPRGEDRAGHSDLRDRKSTEADAIG